MPKNACSVRPLKRDQMQGGARRAGHPRERVKAYAGYAAASARARGVPVRRMGPRRWAFFSGLLGVGGFDREIVREVIHRENQNPGSVFPGIVREAGFEAGVS